MKAAYKLKVARRRASIVKIHILSPKAILATRHSIERIEYSNTIYIRALMAFPLIGSTYYK